jgi:hypothetical protein
MDTTARNHNPVQRRFRQSYGGLIIANGGGDGRRRPIFFTFWLDLLPKKKAQSGGRTFLQGFRQDDAKGTVSGHSKKNFAAWSAP